MTQEKVTTTVDQEYQALCALVEALKPIESDKEAIRRVLWWAQSRFIGMDMRY